MLQSNTDKWVSAMNLLVANYNTSALQMVVISSKISALVGRAEGMRLKRRCRKSPQYQREPSDLQSKDLGRNPWSAGQSSILSEQLNEEPGAKDEKNEQHACFQTPPFYFLVQMGPSDFPFSHPFPLIFIPNRDPLSF